MPLLQHLTHARARGGKHAKAALGGTGGTVCTLGSTGGTRHAGPVPAVALARPTPSFPFERPAMEPHVGTPRAIPDYMLDLRQDERADALKARAIILEAISRAADRGDICPSGEMLNELTGHSALSTAAYQVRQLEVRGWIKVERFQRSRTVLVVATGRRTAPSRETLPHWRVRGVRTGRKGRKG